MRRADALVDAAQAAAATSRGADVMLLMGSDFTYANALTWYTNMDRLVAAVNRGGRATAEYSTPERYLAAKAAAGGAWPLRTDDLFPYADSPHTYWTGALPLPAVHAMCAAWCIWLIRADVEAALRGVVVLTRCCGRPALTCVGISRPVEIGTFMQT